MDDSSSIAGVAAAAAAVVLSGCMYPFGFPFAPS